jgi:hypothetical protein
VCSVSGERVGALLPPVMWVIRRSIVVVCWSFGLVRGESCSEHVNLLYDVFRVFVCFDVGIKSIRIYL